MRHIVLATIVALPLAACGGSQAGKSGAAAQEEPGAAPATTGGEAASGGGSEAASGGTASGEANEFALRTSDGSAKQAQGVSGSKIKPTRTEAALKFIVVDKDKGPIPGIVVALTAPDGRKYYTGETDSSGYAEVLVPVGQKYDLVYLSLGRREIAASVPVSDEPNQSIKLTLRYKFITPAPPERNAPPSEEPRFVLEGVLFDAGKAAIRDESIPRLDSVAEYMLHKQSARIEISGHTDNLGNAKVNKALSLKRAQACRDYLISKGVDGGRIEAVGFGDERPIASNDTEEGRQQNRRIEATEL